MRATEAGGCHQDVPKLLETTTRSVPWGPRGGRGNTGAPVPMPLMVKEACAPPDPRWAEHREGTGCGVPPEPQTLPRLVWGNRKSPLHPISSCQVLHTCLQKAVHLARFQHPALALSRAWASLGPGALSSSSPPGRPACDSALGPWAPRPRSAPPPTPPQHL